MITELERQALEHAKLAATEDGGAAAAAVADGKRCRRCGTVLQILTAQLRSADEGMTTIEICKTCKTLHKR